MFALVVLGLTVVTALHCDLENSGCAHSSAKNGYYAGVLDDPATGRPAADRHLGVWTASRGDYAVHINTDAHGRYCLVWASESVVPAASFPRRRASVGPHRDDVPLLSHLGWRPLNGRLPPTGCQKSNLAVLWDRYSGFASSGVWRTLLVLSLAALAFVIAGRVPLGPARHIISSIGVLVGLAATCLAITVIA